MFDRKPTRLLNKNGVTQKHAGSSRRSQAAELVGFQHELGLLGQPTSFYVGICFGMVFQAALVTISVSLF